nr:putative LRR receptor-like protein kinase [Tanacetum cinerariifolium]
MANEGEDHELVADGETPTEFALMANTESKTGLPEFVDDTVTDYSRPSPTIASTSAEGQNKDSSTSEDVASPNPPKPFVKFVKPKDSQPESKSKEQETPKKSQVKYAEQYRHSNKKPKTFLKSSAVRTQYRALWVPTVNRNNLPVSIKFSTGRRNFPTVTRKFPTASKKFTTGSTKNHTADMGRKGKADSSQKNIDDKGYWDSGCSRHMTGNISYLSDFEPFDGGYVSFGQGGCKITGKGTIKTGKLEFENVYFVKDLKYNMFSVSQICDNKNGVLFTDVECIVLGRNLKLLDDANILLRTPRQHNMVLVNKSQNKTLYELFNGRTPAIGFLKPFGCHVMILNTLDNLRKFEAKGDEGYFIGYSMSSKAFKVFNKRTRRVKENLHVEFLENKAIEKSAGPNWLFDIDSLTKSMNYVPVDAGTHSTNISGTKVTANQEVKKDVSPLRYIVLPNWAHDALLETSSSKPHVESSTQVPEGSGNLNLTVSSSNPPTDQMETLTVESPIPTMDVNSAFLYGTIDEEIYVMQPPGFQDPAFPAKVYKVEKAMYGLHQAPRAWYGTLSKYLLKNGFQRGTIDQTLFIIRQREDFILVQVYVYDIIFGSSNP